MSPDARAEMDRVAAARWTFSDMGDAVVAVLCAIAVVFLAGVWTGAEAARKETRYCAQSLDDGRRLNAYGLGERGHTRCAYEAPKFRRG